MTSTQRATVVRIVNETRDCRSFELDIERYPAVRPGQHAAVGVTIDGVRHERTFSFSSLASAGERPTISVKRRRDGFVSRWFNETCAVGDTIEVSEPRGEFVLRPGIAPVAFFAAGSGITPIFAMLRAALHDSCRNVTLFYVNRSPADVIFAAHLERLKREFAGRLSVCHAFTAGRGSVPDGLIGQAISAAAGRDVYLCGPGGFMQCFKRLAARAGLATSSIFSESFGPDPVGDTPAAERVALFVRQQYGSAQRDLANPFVRGPQSAT